MVYIKIANHKNNLPKHIEMSNKWKMLSLTKMDCKLRKLAVQHIKKDLKDMVTIQFDDEKKQDASLRMC